MSTMCLHIRSQFSTFHNQVLCSVKLHTVTPYAILVGVRRGPQQQHYLTRTPARDGRLLFQETIRILRSRFKRLKFLLSVIKREVRADVIGKHGFPYHSRFNLMNKSIICSISIELFTTGIIKCTMCVAMVKSLTMQDRGTCVVLPLFHNYKKVKVLQY